MKKKEMEIFPSIAERRVANNEQILHLALEIYSRITEIDQRLTEHINTDREAIATIIQWLNTNKEKP